MKYIRPILNSLIFKIGIIIVLSEIIVLLVVGLIYVNRFSDQVDRRIATEVQIPGHLMETGLLSYNSVENRETIRQLIGEEIIDALIVGPSNRVYFSPDSNDLGQDISDLPGVDVSLFNIDEPMDTLVFEEGNIISVSPFFGPDDETLRLFLYIKAGTGEAENEKIAVVQLFILGSLATVIITSLIIILSFRFVFLVRIDNVLNVLERVESGDLTARIPDSISGDEIGVLNRRVNSMTSQLEGVIVTREQYVIQLEQTQETLIVSEERFRLLVETAASIILYLSPDFRIMEFNPEAERLYGRKREDVLGLDYLKLFIPEDIRAIIKADIKKILAGNPTRDFENLVKAHNGNEYIIVWNVNRVLDSQGNAIGIVAVGQDITERKHLEAESRRADILQAELEKEKELLALKDRFVSMVSHEFRTPLAVIRTSSDMLLRYGNKLDEGGKAKKLGMIQAQINKLLHLIDSTLTISRTQSGKTEFTPALLNIDSLCRNIFEQVQFTDSEKHRFEFTNSVPDKEIMIDANLLQHILTNLLVNAVKYSPEGRLITFDLDYDSGNMILKISDEGIGIPEEDQARLFEPFHRANNVGKVQGTGLGLSIVKEYVELHGGSIEVESILGNGSTFKIILPIA